MITDYKKLVKVNFGLLTISSSKCYEQNVMINCHQKAY